MTVMITSHNALSIASTSLSAYWRHASSRSAAAAATAAADLALALALIRALVLFNSRCCRWGVGVVI